jgi:ATP-dependent helicase/nuclease subunit A
MTADARQRTAALDPTASFIVEAPAGSGKTELLTQRYLKLLAGVEEPEQIIAITFTRKAAAEMRQRIVASLRAARADDQAVPAHRRLTVALARVALLRSDERGWDLLQQPQRLRIFTIDALNASLARQLPVLANGIGSLDVTDDARRLYRLAAQRTTDALGEEGELGASLRTLLAAAGNALSRLEDWLTAILPERDRWLRLYQQIDGTALHERISQSLERLQQDHVAALSALAGAELAAQLASLLETRSTCRDPEEAGAVPGSTPSGPGETDRAALWSDAASLLLTGAGDWRRRITRREGIPAHERRLREELLGIISAFRDIEGMREHLVALAALTNAAPDQDQQTVLNALGPILRRLLAEIRIAFAEAQTVDHTELALAALEALGAVDAPSDLLLALDRRIEHILVDEFQDTSHLQWDLLERLTAGWEAHDGRSLFIVGDPMQSIYRFRDADLALFGQAAERGIGEVRLEPIRLTVNFRSAPELLAWSNSAFERIFEARTSLDSSAPRFSKAEAGQTAAPAAGVEIHTLTKGDEVDEIAHVVGLVRREVDADPSRSIGILVRSRTHLVGLRAALAAAGLPAHAVEIDSLTDTQLGIDLIAVSQALLHEGDRLAWLSLLKNPCCGLSWADLTSLCGDGDERTIWALLADDERLERMSAEGRQRAQWLRQRLEQGRALRPFASLGQWLRACWMLIDGPAALGSPAELEVAERFFRDLDGLARAGDVDDPARLRDAFARPSGSDAPTESGIEIMTIHRAKGLEFDTVILLGLSRSTRRNDSNYIILKDINLQHSGRVPLVAVPGGRSPNLYDFVAANERLEEAAERARLLYVAATRARSRLHLVAVRRGCGDAPPSGSLLESLWPGIEASAATSKAASANDRGGAEATRAAASPRLIDVPLRRLRFGDAMPTHNVMLDEFQRQTAARPEFEWVHPASVQVGTLIHAELQRWAEHAAAAGVLSPPQYDLLRYRRELALLGVEAADLRAAGERVVAALERVWTDPTGRWVLEPRAEAWCELRLSRLLAGRIEHLQLDRSFVAEDGERWIIDYKTGRHLGADVEAFLDAEVERYRLQLESYAQAMAAIDARPLRVALYFPLLGRLKEWVPRAVSAST